MLLRWLIRRQIKGFERAYDYDMGYARDMLAVSPRALRRFSKIFSLSRHREDVPNTAWYAVKIATTLAEDCGPCTQLVVTMAERDGVNPAIIRAVLAGDEQAMGDEAALGFRFAQAVLRHAAEADALRNDIVARWGRKALVSLAIVIASSRVFPTVKYALGHGRACTRVTVSGADACVVKQAA